MLRIAFRFIASLPGVLRRSFAYNPLAAERTDELILGSGQSVRRPCLARVGGESGWDYIYADDDGRRLYIPRGATREIPATDGKAAVPPVAARLTIFDLDTLASAAEIPGVSGEWS